MAPSSYTLKDLQRLVIINQRFPKFSSSPEYGWFGRSPVSFNVVNRIAITISNEHHLQEIAAIADKYAEIKLGDTAFKPELCIRGCSEMKKINKIIGSRKILGVSHSHSMVSKQNRASH